MFKRPQIRPREPPRPFHKRDVLPGSLVYDIINPKPTESYKQPIRPVFRQNDYIALFNRYQREAGLPEKTFDHLPPESDYTERTVVKPPRLEALDWIYLTVNVLKNGKVKVKLNTSVYDMYEKYYKKNKIPPNKTLVKCYKTLGFSNEFIDTLDKKLLEKPKISKIVAAKIDKVFNKPAAPKTKKKKQEPEPEPEQDIEEVSDDEEEDQEDDDPGEDGEMDVEVDQDDIDEEQPPEEYFSDGE